eukprot:GFYU01034710.1.p1 GENE.GFYU01034710.1~~GFYU01034710.1.p1  ORF type:complete len:136 (-),score=15.48 GFYU01034710.1:34-441(-)
MVTLVITSHRNRARHEQTCSLKECLGALRSPSGRHQRPPFSLGDSRVLQHVEVEVRLGSLLGTASYPGFERCLWTSRSLLVDEPSLDILLEEPDPNVNPDSPRFRLVSCTCDCVYVAFAGLPCAHALDTRGLWLL